MKRILFYRLKKELRFEAAHVLTGLPEGHPCGRVHGHSYRVEVELVGTELDDNGFLIDFNHLKGIRDYFDHQFLNELAPFKKQSPTAENIAYNIYQMVGATILKLDAVDDVKVERVGVWETPTSYAEVAALDVEGA